MADLKTRYVVNYSIYIYAENDEKAKKKGEKIEKKIDSLTISACAKMENLHEQPYMTNSCRKVKI